MLSGRHKSSSQTLTFFTGKSTKRGYHYCIFISSNDSFHRTIIGKFWISAYIVVRSSLDAVAAHSVRTEPPRGSPAACGTVQLNSPAGKATYPFCVT
jgi:hypothetical protein